MHYIFFLIQHNNLLLNENLILLILDIDYLIHFYFHFYYLHLLKIHHLKKIYLFVLYFFHFFHYFFYHLLHLQNFLIVIYHLWLFHHFLCIFFIHYTFSHKEHTVLNNLTIVFALLLTFQSNLWYPQLNSCNDLVTSTRIFSKCM